MADHDATPQRENFAAYAGDTFTLEVVAPAELVDGLDWAAQVRATREAPGPPDAVFDIIEPTEPGGSAYLTLPAAITRALAAESGRQVRVHPRGAAKAIVVQRYTGEWDCQVSDAGTDPVTTLVQGTLTFDLDVTRDEEAAG